LGRLFVFEIDSVNLAANSYSVHRIILIVIVSLLLSQSALSSPFVSVQGHRLILNGRPYRFVGTNYWYGPLIALEKDPERGIRRLTRELDFLKRNGVINVRLMAGAEGSGPINGVIRVGPALQPEQSRFDERVLDGLDRVLYELGKRHMTAVIFLSNNWEWSGGFQQYLLWNGLEPRRFINDKPSWDEYRDLVSQFYLCESCKAAYRKQAELVLSRVNKYSGKRYIDDPAIMAWELANEPRPMRPIANEAYSNWISETAALIKSKDPHHLVTAGTEGWIGTDGVQLYEQINADPNIDYLTIHIWPKNWAWFSGGKLADGYQNVIAETDKYISENVNVAKKLNKPLVIEEFGLPRDEISFDAARPTTFRNKYYAHVLSLIAGRPSGNAYIAGANFWAFGGGVRPVAGQAFWKVGDQYLGDPPMEEQGLNTVYDTDLTTWGVINAAARTIERR
jgi:mannan endo-1,4-beta-mannosidase